MKQKLTTLLLACLILTGCGGSDEATAFYNKSASLSNEMQVAADYNVLINDRSITETGSFSFHPGISSAYVEVKRNSDSGIVFEQLFEVGPTSSQTLRDFSLIVSGDGTDPKVLLLDDNDLTAPSSGKVKLRLVNLSVNRGAVDIYVVANIGDCAPLNVALVPVASNLAVGEKTGFIEVDEAANGLCYYPQGAATPTAITSLIYLPRKIMTAVIVDDGAAGDKLISYSAPDIDCAAKKGCN